MAVVAFLSFTTPAMLGGLALLTLPILAHFLHRHSRHRILFPTIRLLQQSVASQSRLYRLRRLILLALRCLAVAAVAAAFARPLWIAADTSAAEAGSAAGVVVLVDTSASTGQQSDGVTLLHRLRAAATRALDSLDTGTDFANVVFADAQPRAVFPRMSRNLPALRAELERIETTYDRADLPQALLRAGELLADFEGQRRLVICSDLQRSNWQEVLAETDRGKLLPAGTRVTVFDVAAREIHNIGLHSPSHFPAQPLKEQTVQVSVEAANYFAVDKQVRVSLRLDGEPIADQTATLAPGERRSTAFELQLHDSRPHRVEFVTGDDALPADNRAFLALQAADRLPVVVVSDDDPHDPGSQAYFLVRALAPHGNQTDRFDVHYRATSTLGEADLAGAAAVFVGYIGELQREQARLLERFVARGGGLLIFCGEGAVDRNLAVLEEAGSGGWLPWKLGRSRNLGVAQQALSITGGKWQSRLLKEFDAQSQIAISEIRFRRTWSVESVRPDAQVLLTFSDGTPALGMRGVGLGQVLLANFSPALESSDLGKYGAFVALMQSLAQQLRPPTGARRQPLAGEPYLHPEPFPLELGADGLVAVGPGEESVAARFSVEEDALVAHLPRTTEPGFYAFRHGEDFIALVAVNVDPREGDLTRIEHAKLVEHFEQEGVRFDQQTAAGWRPVLETHGRPLWGFCFAAAMCFVAVELFLVGWWRR